jgi:hypothetical protein
MGPYRAGFWTLSTEASPLISDELSVGRKEFWMARASDRRLYNIVMRAGAVNHDLTIHCSDSGSCINNNVERLAWQRDYIAVERIESSGGCAVAWPSTLMSIQLW